MVAGQGRLSATGARVRLTQPRTMQKTFPFGKAFCMVRVGGVEPPSQPWEGYIMAVIRHPLACYHTINGGSTGVDSPSASPKLHGSKPACSGRFPCDPPLAGLTPSQPSRRLHNGRYTTPALLVFRQEAIIMWQFAISNGYK